MTLFFQTNAKYSALIYINIYSEKQLKDIQIQSHL